MYITNASDTLGDWEASLCALIVQRFTAQRHSVMDIHPVHIAFDVVDLVSRGAGQAISPTWRLAPLLLGQPRQLFSHVNCREC